MVDVGRVFVPPEPDRIYEFEVEACEDGKTMTRNHTHRKLRAVSTLRVVALGRSRMNTGATQREKRSFYRRSGFAFEKIQQ
jgi:hypothetical protein